MRPTEYIREIMYEKEVQRRRAEKKREYKLRKTTKKHSLMALAQQTTSEEQKQFEDEKTELEAIKESKQAIVKEELVPTPKVIGFNERLETEAEV